jgi:hypothetical protein
MKKILLFMVLPILLFAQTLDVNNFTTDIFSKIDKAPKEVNLSLVIEGRYVKDENYKIIDAINVVIGSFYVENLITSQGKESFKKLLIEYAAKKYSVDIDDIYIQKFKILQSPSTDEIVKALKKEGCCK